MSQLPFNPIAPASRKLPLRVIFVMSTLLQVFTAVGLTGYFSFRNGQEAVNDVATQLRNEVTNRVKERLENYVAIPHLINQLNANAIELGQLDTQNIQSQERYFWGQIEAFPMITYNFYGSATGQYLGARRMLDGSLQVIRRNEATGENQYYATDAQGDRVKLVQVAPGFDARQRPWYLQGIEAKKPAWSEIYADFSTGGLAITAVKPVYDRQGQLQGVLGSDFVFAQVNQFLRSLKIGQSGQTFIIERSGQLVATSTSDLTYKTGVGNQRVQASDSLGDLVRLTAQHLQKRFSSLQQIDRSLQLDFAIDGARQFVQVTPLKDDKGLDWLIVVVVPEADFMGRIEANTRTTALLCLLSLGIATIVGLLTSRWIVKPILGLNNAAKQLAQGHWEQEQQLPTGRSDEIGELASSFNSMTEQLKESFETLEQKVEQRTEELAQSNHELENRNVLIRKIFGRYLSDEVVTNLLESPSGLKLGGERRKITMLTSDLRGFTATAERLSPEEVIKVLNFYLEYMADVITQYEGTIDEFMGDGILALFGAPTARLDDAERAIACAIAMQLAMQPVNQQMQAWGLPPLEMGIGVHTGEVIVGNIGSEKRTKYGVVGSQVNLTYRIESCSVGGQVLISESTFAEVGSMLWINSTKQVQMKGVQHPIAIHEVGGITGIHNLFLTKEEVIFVELMEQIPFQYVILEGKEVCDRIFQASIVRLSQKEALIYYPGEIELLPTALTNLKLNLLTSDLEVSQEIYAKVSDRPSDPNHFYIHFTAMSPIVQVILSQVFERNQNRPFCF
jgi:adenylate cyclase